MDIKKIPSEKLIEEINKRNLLEELGEKGDWLKEKGYLQIPFNFITYKENAINMFYTYFYIKEHSIEELEYKLKNLENIIENS